MSYPAVMNPGLVGSYEPSAYAGGGYVWDEVLEYRVWCYPESGAADDADGSDDYYAFESYEEALAFAEATGEPRSHWPSSFSVSIFLNLSQVNIFT